MIHDETVLNSESRDQLSNQIATQDPKQLLSRKTAARVKELR